MTYREKDPAMDITSLAFSTNMPGCGSFTYTLSKSDGSAYDSTVFTFDAATPKITVQTNDPTKVLNFYTLKVNGA